MKCKILPKLVKDAPPPFAHLSLRRALLTSGPRSPLSMSSASMYGFATEKGVHLDPIFSGSSYCAGHRTTLAVNKDNATPPHFDVIKVFWQFADSTEEVKGQNYCSWPGAKLLESI